MKTSDYTKTKLSQARWGLNIAAIVGVLVISCLVFWLSYFYGFQEVEQGVDSMKPVLSLWRLGLFILIVSKWNDLIILLSDWAQLSSEMTQLYLDYRWRFALWLLIFEVLIVQNVLAHFLDVLIN